MCEPARKTHALWYTTFSTPPPPTDSSIRWESVHGAALYASLLIPHTKESKENSRGIDLKTCYIPYTIFPFDTSFLMVHTKQVSHLLLSIHMPHWFHILTNPFYCLLSNEFFFVFFFNRQIITPNTECKYNKETKVYLILLIDHVC